MKHHDFQVVLWTFWANFPQLFREPGPFWHFEGKEVRSQSLSLLLSVASLFREQQPAIVEAATAYLLLSAFYRIVSTQGLDTTSEGRVDKLFGYGFSWLSYQCSQIWFGWLVKTKKMCQISWILTLPTFFYWILHLFCDFFASLASKIFAKHGKTIATYYQSFKGQGDLTKQWTPKPQNQKSF